MAKAYWIACYHAIKNPDALAAYAKLAAPAIQAAGGRFLVRAGGGDDPVERLAQLACASERLAIAARAAREPGCIQPAAEILRGGEPLERLAGAAGERREELEHGMPEAKSELVGVGCRSRGHRTPV